MYTIPEVWREGGRALVCSVHPASWACAAAHHSGMAQKSCSLTVWKPERANGPSCMMFLGQMGGGGRTLFWPFIIFFSRERTWVRLSLQRASAGATLWCHEQDVRLLLQSFGSTLCCDFRAGTSTSRYLEQRSRTRCGPGVASGLI